MRDEPSASALLTLAREVLREKLLVHIPPEDRYSALMVANVMAIAARRIDNGDEPERRELERLKRIIDLDDRGLSPREALERGYRRLGSEIRKGDLSRSRAVYDLLMEQAVEKVRESNPGYLQP